MDKPIQPLMLRVGWRITRNRVLSPHNDGLFNGIMLGMTLEIAAIGDDVVHVIEIMTPSAFPWKFEIPRHRLTTEFFEMD